MERAVVDDLREADDRDHQRRRLWGQPPMRRAASLWLVRRWRTPRSVPGWQHRRLRPPRNDSKPVRGWRREGEVQLSPIVAVARARGLALPGVPTALAGWYQPQERVVGPMGTALAWALSSWIPHGEAGTGASGRNSCCHSPPSSRGSRSRRRCSRTRSAGSASERINHTCGPEADGDKHTGSGRAGRNVVPKLG